MTFHTNMSGGKDFMQLNKDRAKSFNPYKKPMICEQLDDRSKSRLDILMADIDDNLEELQKQKEDYDNQSQFTKVTDNAYLYSKEDMEHMEKINDSLRKVAPMLPPCEDDNESKISGSRIGHREESKFLDSHSMKSLPFTTVTRRSNFTMLTLKTQGTALTKLPKERNLREMAEQRLQQSQLREIEVNLKKINETEDLSYALGENKTQIIQTSDHGIEALVPHKKLIDQDTLMRLIEECRDEEERRSIMYEMNDQPDTYTERSQMQLAKFDETSQKLGEAEMMIHELE